MAKSTARNNKRRLGPILAMGAVSLLILFFISLTFDVPGLTFTDAIDALVGYLSKYPDGPYTVNEIIVGGLYFPRAIAVIGVGMALSVAGAFMQALIRNPLVDPYITGTSSGAALGASLIMLAGFTIAGAGIFTIPIAAFIGALVAFMITLLLAEASGGRALNYVLAGIVVGTALSSVVSLLLILGGNDVHGVLFWLFGSFANIRLDEAIIIIVPTIFLSAAVLVYARELNVILLGHEQAWQLGVNSRSFKRLMMVITALLTGIAVAFTGIIAFLGLIVPHIARILVGGDHRLLLPASMVLGANILLIADLAARSFTVGELPVGILISLIGAPFFGYLLVRRGKEYVG
jgi:iron complex transport system permease protein